MNRPGKSWHAISAPNERALRCASCGGEFDAGALLGDHHPRVCPVCGVECLVLDWKRLCVQIVVNDAPPVLTRAIRWAQKELDELEFTELLCTLEDLAEAAQLADGAREAPTAREG
jgi:hypothetical protein